MTGAGDQIPSRVTLRDRLSQPGVFVVAAEVVTARGVITATRSRSLVETARELGADPRVDALSITDNPGGHSMLSPDALGTDLAGVGQEVIIHLSCKDSNRNGMESRAWKMASLGFHNILALSGDYPQTGQRGLSAPVFDIDSVGLLQILSDMNDGVRDHRNPETTLERTNFFLGCVVTNHKRFEREVMPQYFKLRKKTRAGARFVINQIGWNARKDDELIRWVRQEPLQLAALANVYLLSRPAARVFHAGRIPGVAVHEPLLELVDRYAAGADRGRAFFVDLAARHVALAKRIGFNGVYLGGHAPAEVFASILDHAADYESADLAALAENLQHPFPDEFYLFERDPITGLSSDTPSATYLESRRKRRTQLPVPLRYRLSRRMHEAVFAEDAPLFVLGTKLYEKLDTAPRSVERAAHVVEQAAKVPMFGCRDCGDCSLPEIAYVCPESQCAKNQRNGPCGGTRDGLCEVYDTECIWAQAYERLKAYGQEEQMLDNDVVLKDNRLAGTSAWKNTFLGRDHHASSRNPSSGDSA
jgi:methylenetetrahydrofolate reductase (NADPH)